MLAEYLALQRATNPYKSKRKSDEAVNSSYVNKERTFHVQILVESSCIIAQKKFYDSASASALFLIFYQTSGSCSYNIVLIKKSVL